MSTPRRLLIVMPSWVGDAVMATPTARALREALPGAMIGALLRPGLDQLLAGTPFFDEVHIERGGGVMGPKRIAARIRPLRYDCAVLLTNSFSTALITRLAGIPRRVGYERDGRGILLTDRLAAPKRRDTEAFRDSPEPGAWAPIPACAYYYRIAEYVLREAGHEPGPMGAMQLAVSPREDDESLRILERARLNPTDPMSEPLAILNPGGNNPAKRWPAERFAQLADHLAQQHGMSILLSGSPNERGLIDAIAEMCDERSRIVRLPNLGVTLSSLKGIIRRCAIMVTNDTGPRHIAAALGTPVVTLFGPTDHRWTTIPFDHERLVLADPTLPEPEVANDHPERCAIDRIDLERVLAETDELLAVMRETRLNPR